MILRYRVSLPGLKGFARVYEVKDTTSLYSFHKQMRADMDFPQDQLVLFKAFDQDGAVSARYGIFDLGSGTIDTVTAGECHKKGEDKFIYFYDTTNVKSVIVTFDGEGGVVRQNAIYPLLVESKGPNPIEFENGYMAFEDLPDDKKKDPDDDDFDDDDDDVADDDREEVEELYDDDDDEE